jgi:hypothetical protein
MQNDENAGGREVSSPHPIEQLLESFAPVGSAIDRDRLMFQAGMQAARTELRIQPPAAPAMRVRLWPIVSLISTAAALAMAVLLGQRPERLVIVEHVPGTVKTVPPQQDQPRPAPTDFVSTQMPSIDRDTNYVLRRDRVLREGLDALAQNSQHGGGSGHPTATQRDLLEQMVGAPLTHEYGQVREVWWQQWLNSGDRL